MPHRSAFGPKVWETTRVMKRLAAWQPGAIKLARRFGEALVCVRYRQDNDGSRRYTTVELVVDEGPIHRRAGLNDIVAVRIGFSERDLQDRALRAGATWDVDKLVWRLPRHAAYRCGFANRIVKR